MKYCPAVPLYIVHVHWNLKHFGQIHLDLSLRKSVRCQMLAHFTLMTLKIMSRSQKVETVKHGPTSYFYINILTYHDLENMVKIVKR